MNQLYIPTVIFLVLCLLVVLYLYIKKTEEVKRYRLMNTHYEDKVLNFSNELQDIVSLNKFCIERWEKCVLENKQLNQSNLALIQTITAKDN